jgi:hypothetical protein
LPRAALLLVLLLEEEEERRVNDVSLCAAGPLELLPSAGVARSSCEAESGTETETSQISYINST